MIAAEAYAMTSRPGTDLGTDCQALMKSPLMRPKMPRPIMPVANAVRAAGLYLTRRDR